MILDAYPFMLSFSYKTLPCLAKRCMPLLGKGFFCLLILLQSLTPFIHAHSHAPFNTGERLHLPESEQIASLRILPTVTSDADRLVTVNTVMPPKTPKANAIIRQLMGLDWLIPTLFQGMQTPFIARWRVFCCHTPLARAPPLK